MQIKILAEGGSMKPGPALSQQLGPAGINIGQVINQINESTQLFKGLTVPITIDVDAATKKFTITVSSPPVSELLKKELGLAKGSGEQKKSYASNASIEQIISVAKQKYPNMLAKDFKSAVKTVVGTCTSLGVLVENYPASEVGRQIDEGKFHAEIKSQKTETDEDKKIKLNEYFKSVHAKQEQLKKQEEEAAKAAEAEKVAAAPATVATTPTATATATTAAPVTASKTPAAKPAGKK